MKSRSQQILGPLLQPRSIVLVLAVADFVWMWVRDSRIAWEFINYHGYYADTYETLILLIAAVLLLLNRIWSVAIAAALSGRTIYVHVFLTLLGISNAMMSQCLALMLGGAGCSSFGFNHSTSCI